MKYYTPAALCSTRVRDALRPLPTVVPFLIAQPKKCPLVASSSHPAADFRSPVLLYTSKLTGTVQLKVVFGRNVIVPPHPTTIICGAQTTHKQVGIKESKLKNDERI